MLYPLQFEPLFRQYLWGGRRLGSVLGKSIGEASNYAESWEVVDHHDGQSVVSNGSLAGLTLGQIVGQYGDELLGRHAGVSSFPLLFKFLDCNRNLSVQVHPDDQRAALLDPPDLGKTEAWVILAADPGSSLYAGLKQGIDRAALEREVARGTTELCLHEFQPRVGDCVFIPAGTVHALGSGLVVAEIQQASNTTYRLFDWNRVDQDGKPRALHIIEALEAIDYERGPVSPQQPTFTGEHAEQLVACDKFILERWQLSGSLQVPSESRFRLLAVLSGQLQIEHEYMPLPLAPGSVVLLPASLADLQLHAQPDTVILHVVLP